MYPRRRGTSSRYRGVRASVCALRGLSGRRPARRVPGRAGLSRAASRHLFAGEVLHGDASLTQATPATFQILFLRRADADDHSGPSLAPVRAGDLHGDVLPERHAADTGPGIEARNVCAGALRRERVAHVDLDASVGGRLHRPRMQDLRAEAGEDTRLPVRETGHQGSVGDQTRVGVQNTVHVGHDPDLTRVECPSQYGRREVGATPTQRRGQSPGRATHVAWHDRDKPSIEQRRDVALRALAGGRGVHLGLPEASVSSYGVGCDDPCWYALGADRAGQNLCGQAFSVDRDLIPARLHVVVRSTDDLFELAEQVDHSPFDPGQMLGPHGLAGGVEVPFGQHAAELRYGGFVRLVLEGPLYPTRTLPGVAEQGVGRAAHRRDDHGHGVIPGGFRGDAGGADELRAASYRGAPELDDQRSLQKCHAPFNARSRSYSMSSIDSRPTESLT